MKTTMTLTLALAMAGGLLQAANLASGLEFRMPEGWTMKSNDTAAVLLPPDMVMEPNGKDPSELYLVAMQDSIRNLEDPQLAAFVQGKFVPAGARASMDGAPQDFHAAGGHGRIFRYNAVSQGVALRMNIYVVELPGGGVAGMVAMARPALLARREVTAFTVAASLSRGTRAAAAAVPVVPSAGIAGQWVERLRGKKLYQFSSYSGSYGSGGMSSQKTLFLGANGMYQFQRSGSVAIYAGGASGSSASQNAAQGRWRIYENSGKTVLELVSNAGATESIVLTTQGTKTMLNGQRWLVGD